METKLKKYSACDPDMLKELDGAAIVCRDAANRWTDNIDVMRAFFRRYNAELTDEKVCIYYRTKSNSLLFS